MWFNLARILVWTALVLLADGLQAQANEIDDDDPCNKYADGIITDVKTNDEHFEDPYWFYNKTITIWKKTLFINMTAEVEMTKGVIHGLSTLKRSGNVIRELKYGRERLSFHMSATDLKMDCDAQIKFVVKTRTSKLHAEMSFIRMSMVLSVDPGTGSNPELEEFKIEDVKGSKVRVGGGILKILTKLLVQALKLFFKNSIRDNTEDAFKTFLKERYEDNAVPAECLQNY